MTPHGPGQVKKAAAVALVSGGAVRVGRAIALALGRRGMQVAVGYHGSAREAGRLVRRLRAEGVAAAAFPCDLRSAAGARRLVRDTVRRFGRLDVLVNSAAMFERTPFPTATPAQFDAHLALNLRGPFFCAQAAARHMGKRGWIVNIGDAGAEAVWPGYIPYTLSKVGVHALTRALAVVLAPRVAVNCVAPGPVLRPPGFPLAAWRRVGGRDARGPAEVAEAVVRFATCPPSVTGRISVVGRPHPGRPRGRGATRPTHPRATGTPTR